MSTSWFCPLGLGLGLDYFELVEWSSVGSPGSGYVVEGCVLQPERRVQPPPVMVVVVQSQGGVGA